MSDTPDTRSIEHRISVFESRFTELLARYAEFADVMEGMNQRIDEHLKFGEEALKIARDEQEEANRKKGLAGLFSKRNQGRINAKILGAIERDFAILKDIQAMTGRNLQLVSDTGEAVKRDIREMMDSIVETIRVFHEGTAHTLRFMADDVELLKQLTAKAYLNDAGTEEDQNTNN